MNTELHFSSENSKWRTPKWLCDEVRIFFKGHFLDPAAPVEQPDWTGATRSYTEEEDGLKQPWAGRVYLNPSYGREIGDWTEKFAQEYREGRMSEGILLLPARPDTQWWAALLRLQPAILFFYGRLTFEGAENSAPFPSVLLYIGTRKQQFIDRFQDKGWVAKVVSL